MPSRKLFVRLGDKVLILSGKDKGKKGKVIAAEPGSGKVKVEGVGIVKKHAKATSKVPQAGIREIEAPIAASRVMIICPACNKPTRVRKEITSDGKRVRICRRCGESVDK